ncbi:MAG TPA: DUF1697 domain-containing protein [Longimicrobiales bacterium]|nr:DUF1697 domain-containing protein [Longimicrobiales bacterium]
MNDYVALLRGINVGGHRVKMDRLRALFRELGHEDVWTLLASGNVGFSSATRSRDALAAGIETHLLEALGFEVPTFLRTPEELSRVLEGGLPVPRGWDPDAASWYVIFLDEPPPAEVRAALAELESETDRFGVEGTEIHWRTRGKLSESPLFGPGIDKATKGVRTTARNVNTVRRLVARFAS